MTREEEYRTLFNHATTGLQLDVDKEFKTAIETVITSHEGIAARATRVKHRNAANKKVTKVRELLQSNTGAMFFMKAQLQRFPGNQIVAQRAKEVFEILSNPFDVARNAYRATHGGVDWIS